MRALGVWAVLVVSTGCELAGGGGGIGGGAGGSGGGGDGFVFSGGFVFVKKADRNLYAANDSDLQTVSRLTTGGGQRQPSLSKDGKTVVFVRQVGTDTEIATVSSSGGP